MRVIKALVIGLAVFAAAASSKASFASGNSFAPTSFELLYQPTYTMATGGPTAQLGTAGGGIRIGYAMTRMIAFELGGYYDAYAFGNVAGATQVAYAARATGDFALAPIPALRLYLGMDANVFFSPPAAFTATNNKDLGAIGGIRFLVGGATKVALGAEYRYAANTVFTYSGGSVSNSAVVGTVGVHFGAL